MRKFSSSMVALLHIIRPRFPIAHALRFRRVAVAVQAHQPAVHPEMTIWGHEKIQNFRQSKWKKKEIKKKNNAKFIGHYFRQHKHNVHAHTLRSDQLC